MKLPSRPVRLIFGILVATLVSGGAGLASAEDAAEEKKGRTFDLEVGTGFILGIESDTTIDDTWGVEIMGVLELNRRLSFEFGAGWGPGEEPDKGAGAGDDNFDLYNAGGGFRWHPTSEPGDGIRPYIATGVRYFNELKGDGTSPAGVYLGPGIRMMLGESSGVNIKVPLWFSISGQTNTLMLPTLSYFYSFN
jgi:hypothetical protein